MMTFYEGGTQSNICYFPGRDDAVDQVMQEWAYKYCVFSEAKIFVTTFNVNGRSAPRSIPAWLVPDRKAPDIYVVGLQEMDLSTQAFLYDVSSRQDEWVNAISNSLPPFAQYSLVEAVRLVGILLVIFKRSDSPFRIPPDSIHSARIATGIQLISRMGNKGGIAVSLKLNDSFLCFVNAHFAAGSDELDKRNQDYREISQIRFNGINKSLFDHDIIFWFGDLNYRLNTENILSNEDIRELCSKGKNYKSLMIFDTLKQQQKLGLVFTEFNEPDQLNFRPSYKYDPGTSNWDSSDKMRCPAWCDRILWWCESGDQVVQIFYDSVNEITLSDHKPVRALFNVTVREIDKSKIKAIYEDAIREADKRLNEALPQIWISDQEVNFGDVYFFESSVRNITIRNVGKTKVAFSFIPQPNQSNISASWLSVTPPNSLLKLGAACSLSLQVLVDKRVAWTVQEKENDQLSDILVLRLDHGRDYFIPVTAVYQKSVFGSSFSDIVHSGIHFSQLVNVDSERSIISSSPTTSIYSAMYRLIEQLRKFGLNNIHFDDISKHSEFIALRKALDTGIPSDLSSVCKSPFNMFNTFLRLLDSFKDPMIPFSMQVDCLRVRGNGPRCWACVEKFPIENRSILECYIDFTRDLITANADALSQLQVMADIAFKSDQGERTEDLQRLKFFETLIGFPKEIVSEGIENLKLLENDRTDGDLIRF